MSILNVTVKRAKYIGVQSTQLNTYVALKLQNVKTTTVCVKGSEPCWDQDFLFETEQQVNNIGLLIEIWSKGMIWDRVLGYKFITLNSILTQQNKIKQQHGNSNVYSKASNEKWYQLDLECITVNGEVTGTKNQTGDMILLDCRFDMPFPGYCEDTEYASNLTCSGTDYTGGAVNHMNSSPIAQDLNKPQLQQQQNYFQARSLEASRENSYDVDDRSSYYDYYSDSTRKMTSSYSPNNSFYYDNKDETDPLSYNSRPKSAINMMNHSIKTSQTCRSHSLERQDTIINCNDDLYYNENDYDYEENLNNSLNKKYMDQDYYISNDKIVNKLEFYDASSNPESDIMIYDMRYNQDYYDDTNQMHKNQQPPTQLNKQLPKIPVKNGSSSYYDDGMNDNYSQNLGLSELPVQEHKPYHQQKKIRMLPQPNRLNQNLHTSNYPNSGNAKILPQPKLDSSQSTDPNQGYYNQIYNGTHLQHRRKSGKTLPSIPMSQSSRTASKLTHPDIEDDRDDFFYDASSNLTQHNLAKKSTTKKLLPQPLTQIGPKPYDIKTDGFKSSNSTKISKNIDSPKSTGDKPKLLPKAPFQNDAKTSATRNINDRRRSSTTILSPKSPISKYESSEKLSSDFFYSAKNDMSPIKLNQNHLKDIQSPVKLTYEKSDLIHDDNDGDFERITKLSDDILNDNKFHPESNISSDTDILDAIKHVSSSQTVESNLGNLPYFSTLHKITPDFSYLFDTNVSIDRHKYVNNFNNLKSTSICDLITERDNLGTTTSYMDDHKLDDAEYLRRYGYMKLTKSNHKLQIIGDLNLNSSAKLLTDDELKLELDKIRNLYDNDIEEYKRKLRLKYLNELNLNYQQKQQELQGELLLQHHNSSKLNKINNYYDDNDIDNKSSILKYYQNNMILSKQAEKQKIANDLNQTSDSNLDVKLDNILSKKYIEFDSKLDDSKHKNYDTTAILNRFKESEKFLDNYKQNKLKLMEEQKILELAKEKLIVDNEKLDTVDSETETINIINNDNLSDQRLNDKHNINLLNNINNNLNLNNNLISNKNNVCEFYNSSNNKINLDNNLIETADGKRKKSDEFTTIKETKSKPIETDENTTDFVSFLNKYNYTIPDVAIASSTTASISDTVDVRRESISSEATSYKETKASDSIQTALSTTIESFTDYSDVVTKATTTSDYLSWQTDFMSLSGESNRSSKSSKFDLEPQTTISISTEKSTSIISSALDPPKKLLDLSTTIGGSTIISTTAPIPKMTIASPKLSSTSFFNTLTQQQQQQPQLEPINTTEPLKSQSVLGAFTSGLKGTLGNVVAGQQQQQSATQQAASSLTSAAKGFGFGLANKFATFTGQQPSQSQQQQQKTQQQQPQNLTKKLFNNFGPATTNIAITNSSEQQSYYNIQKQPIRNIKNEFNENIVPTATTTSSQLDFLDKFSGTLSGPTVFQATTTTICTTATATITTTIRTEPLEYAISATTAITTTASNNNIVEQQWQKYNDSSALLIDCYHVKNDIVGQQDYATDVIMQNETVVSEQNVIESGMIDDQHYSRYGDSILDSKLLFSNLPHSEAKTSTLYITTDPMSIQKTDDNSIFEPQSNNEIADGNIDLSQNSSNYICDSNLSGIEQNKNNTMISTLAITSTNENKLSSAQFPSNTETVIPKTAVIPPKQKEQPAQQQSSGGGLFGSFLSKAKGAAAAIAIVPSGNTQSESGAGATQSATSSLGANLRNMGGKLGGDFVKALSSQIQPQQTSAASKTATNTNLTGLTNTGNYNLMSMDNQQQQNKFLPQLPMLDRQQQQNGTSGKKSLPQIQNVDAQQLIRQGTNNLLQKQQPTEIYVDTEFYNNLSENELAQNNLIDPSDNEVLHYDNDYYLNSLNINHEYSAHSKPLKSNYDQNKFSNGIQSVNKTYKSNFINNQTISEPLHLNHLSFNYQSSSSQQQQKTNHLPSAEQEPEIYEEHFENPNDYYLSDTEYPNLENYSNYYEQNNSSIATQQELFQHNKYYHHNNYNEDFFNEEDELDYLSTMTPEQLNKMRLSQQAYHYDDENDESDEIDDDDDDDDTKLDPYKQHYYYHQIISNNNNILQLQQQQKFVTKEKLLLQQHQKQPPLDYIEESNDDYFDNLNGATVTDITTTTAGMLASTTTTLKDISVINYGTTIADTKTKTSTTAATVVPLSTTVKSQKSTTVPIIDNDFKDLGLKSSITTANTQATTAPTTTNLLTKQAAQQGLHKQKSIVDDDDDDDADDDDDDDDLDLFNNDLDENYIDEEDDSQNAIELYEKDDKLMALHKINNHGNKMLNTKLPEDTTTIPTATIPASAMGLNFTAKITTSVAAKKTISFGGAAAGVAAAIAVDPTAIATDLVIGSEEQQQLIAAGKKILQRGETEEIITGDIGIRSGSPPIKSDVTPRQRWHWAYNKIIMQLNEIGKFAKKPI